MKITLCVNFSNFNADRVRKSCGIFEKGIDLSSLPHKGDELEIELGNPPKVFTLRVGKVLQVIGKLPIVFAKASYLVLAGEKDLNVPRLFVGWQKSLADHSRKSEDNYLYGL